MSIEIAGAVYCPLSPGDPQQRLHALLEQTQTRLVLVHDMTKDKFRNDHTTLDIDATINSGHLVKDVDLDRLSTVSVTPNSLAYVIFTSGSTGTPKAVSFQLSFPITEE